MSRKIELIVNGCDDCPFCRYDGNYNIGFDAGWDCEHPDIDWFRIVDEGGYEQIRKGSGVESRIGHVFPDKCPLPKQTNTPVAVLTEDEEILAREILKEEEE